MAKRIAPNDELLPCAALKCSIRSIDNAITEFVRRDILTRAGRAEYELNRYFFLNFC
jgi:hypothetical protein